MNKFLNIVVIGIMFASATAIADSSSNSGANSGSSSGATASGGRGGQGGDSVATGGVAVGVGGQAQSGSVSAVNISGAVVPAGVSAEGTAGVQVGGDTVAPFATKIQFGNSTGSDLSKSVPSVFAAGVTAGGSNPCVVSVGFGGSIAGGGVNFSQAYNDAECQVRESLRLMVAILPNSNDKGSQMLIRETACQSDVYWQAMERVYIGTQDERFLCTNPRPESKPIAIRDPSRETVETVKHVPTISESDVVSYDTHSFLDYE